jgi:hypothetical protein
MIGNKFMIYIGIGTIMDMVQTKVLNNEKDFIYIFLRKGNNTTILLDAIPSKKRLF